MPTNDFLPFATAGGANVTAQATYAAAGYVSTGRTDGILPSDVYNKIARQSSIGAYLLGQLVVDQLGVDALDNGTVATVLANLKLAIAKTPTQPTVQRFTSGSGTYTPTSANVRRIRVRMVGGGGGGGARTTNNGSTGGTTTFGSWTCIGGGGGNSTGGGGGNQGSGGVNGTGTLINRQNGGAGFGAGVQTTLALALPGSSGGFSLLGAGAGASNGGSAGGSADANTGGGGQGGGGTTNASPGSGGGAGEYVEFFVNNPTATPYAVGGGGVGGAAGGSAAGNGGSGSMIIEELYS